METEALLQDIDVVEDYEEETELKDFKCELLDQYGVYQKRSCVITTQFIEFYKSDNSSTPCFYNEIYNIQAIYINRNRDHLVLKRSVPNIVLRCRNKPARVVNALRCIYSVLYESEIPVYEVKEKDLDIYLDDPELPPDRYLVPEDTDEYGRVMTTRELMEEDHQDGMAAKVYSSSKKTKISQIEKKPESRRAQEEFKNMLLEESDSEEEAKFGQDNHESRVQSFNEDVDYDSDEDRANLMETHCKLTGSQLK